MIKIIPIIEEYLKNLINNNLTYIKNNPDVLDSIFEYSSNDFINKFKVYIQSSKIKVTIGYPREPALLPCYSIILGQEEELAESIGEEFETEYDNSSLAECTETVKAVVEPYGNIKLQLSHKAIKDVMSVCDVDGNTYYFEVSNHQTGLLTMFDSNIHDGDEFIIAYNYYKNSIDNQGTDININYRIECWTDNADLTTYMYHLLKYIMLTNRVEMLKDNIRLPKLSGGDLEPVPEYYPSFVYRRTLIISALIENSYNERFDIIQQSNIKNSVYRMEEMK